jgi:hypothetical protein
VHDVTTRRYGGDLDQFGGNFEYGDDLAFSKLGR